MPIPLTSTSSSFSGVIVAGGSWDVAVVRHLMAAVGDFAHQVGVGFGDVPGDVEAGGDALGVQHVQDARGGRRLGPYSAMDRRLG